MSGVWLVIVPVALVALLFVLKAVRDVSRNMRTLVKSMHELRDGGFGLNRIRDELKAERATGEDAPPQ